MGAKIEPAKLARLLAVARDEPDLPSCALAERFGLSESRVSDLLRDHGLRRIRPRIARDNRSFQDVQRKRRGEPARAH